MPKQFGSHSRFVNGTTKVASLLDHLDSGEQESSPLVNKRRNGAATRSVEWEKNRSINLF